MARTLGSEDLDQVSHAGRRILIGWTGGGDPAILHNLGSAQSLPRELSLAPDRSLRQRFVPELQTLRTSEVRASGRDAWFPRFVGLQAEVCATLPAAACSAPDAKCGVMILGDGERATKVLLAPELGLVMVDATAQGNAQVRGGPLPPPDADGAWHIHLYADHSILEVIVNNATALVVYVLPTAAAGRVALIGLPDGEPTGASIAAWRLSSPGHVYPAII